MPQPKPGVLGIVQGQSHEWRQKNFPDTSTAMHQMLGIAEETGELAHAVLKNAQGIRGAADDIQANMMIADALGDILIYACGLASARGLDLETCLWEAWKEVRERDWVEHPEDGGENGQGD